MNEQSLPMAASEGEYEHQGVVKPEASHVVVAVEGASAVVEVLVGLQHAAVGIVDVFYYILVASVLQFVHDGVSVAGIEAVNPCLPLPYRRQFVVDGQMEKKIFAFLCRFEWCEGRQ